MDSVKFIEESKRMCKSHDSCCECPAYADDGPCKLHTLYGASATEKIELVEKWSAEHLIKTRQSVFLEQWPNATMFDGVLGIKPCFMDDDFESIFCEDDGCAQCRREFWMQEVE